MMTQPLAQISIGPRQIGLDEPTYFIADVASNHDGDLSRAKDLIWEAKQAGADAVKFQHFIAGKIVSDHGFRSLGGKMSHQSTWQKSVFEMYADCECKRSWTDDLVETAKLAEIDFFSTPYDLEAIELLNPHVPAYKIGSGDITWVDFIETIAKLGKPIMIATGAADMADTDRAMQAILKHNEQCVLMQCNTNYTGSLENFKYINLNVLKTFAQKYPQVVLGLSDHTPGSATVLGAITLGARVIEKHFTDDNDRVGPDHPFSMNPQSWAEMVERSRELELALGDHQKDVQDNEQETVVVQRRCIRLTSDLPAGQKLGPEHLECLRPAPAEAIEPYHLPKILGKVLKTNKQAGEALCFADLEA